MEIAKNTDLPDLLEHLGYSLKRLGRYYTTRERDSIRIKNRRTWKRYCMGKSLAAQRTELEKKKAQAEKEINGQGKTGPERRKSTFQKSSNINGFRVVVNRGADTFLVQPPKTAL